MPETENTTGNAAAVVALAQAGVSFVVTETGQLIVNATVAEQHAEQPAATKPKAKTTPTKRKPKANAFYTEVIVGGRANRMKRSAWKATKGDNMYGVPQKVAERNGWSSSKTGKVTKKGKSAKPKRTVSWA